MSNIDIKGCKVHIVNFGIKSCKIQSVHATAKGAVNAVGALLLGAEDSGDEEFAALVKGGGIYEAVKKLPNNVWFTIDELYVTE